MARAGTLPGPRPVTGDRFTEPELYTHANKGRTNKRRIASSATTADDHSDTTCQRGDYPLGQPRSSCLLRAGPHVLVQLSQEPPQRSGDVAQAAQAAQVLHRAFEHVVAALVHGSGYERIATPRCSDRTIRRRLAEWVELGLAAAVHAAALRAYDQIIGLELGDIAVGGCVTKAPCGGERAGPSLVARGKGRLKRSAASDGHGIPPGIASAGANRHDSPLLAPALQAASQQLDHILPGDRTCHLDAGYDSTVTRQLLDELGFDGAIARKGIPAPIQASAR
jgi:hypothetical protein